VADLRMPGIQEGWRGWAGRMSFKVVV
jgi:hypothetical protein